MNALILTEAYPSENGSSSMYFVHSRNLYYEKNGINVTVINFSAPKRYEIDGIKVITLSDYIRKKGQFDILITHAPNIRNSYRFIKKFGYRFNKKVFIFHGHEVLHINKYYPKPYYFKKKEKLLHAFIQNLYDDFKLSIWRRYFLKNIKDIRLIFVSNWLFNQFKSELKLDNNLLKGHAKVISNSIGEFFENNRYSPSEIKYDFLTIRSNMDEPNYGVDIVIKTAEKNPKYIFLIIGKGRIFDYYSKPDNLEWIKGEMTHKDLMKCMNQSRYAFIPTRHDTQGLMACEMASVGMPLITSNIDVCREVFSDCPAVAFIDNKRPDIDGAIEKLGMTRENQKWERYYAKNTIYKELEYLKKYCF